MALTILLAGAQGSVPVYAGAGGTLRWAAWETGSPGASATRLMLLDSRADRAPAWSSTLPDSYSPRLRAVPGWSFKGRPVVALTVQYGAAAAEVSLRGLDGTNRPVLLAEVLAPAIGWATAADGAALLVAYQRPSSALIPECFAWDTLAVALAAAPCPALPD